jgi:transposase
MENDWTKVLGFPGYRVYRQEIDEEHKQLKLWIRRKRGNRSMVCAGCGRRVHKIHEVYEREIRDLPCFEYQTTVVVERYRVDCRACGVKAEKVAQLPSKSPYSKRFEDAVGQCCESASARQVARRMGLAESTVRGIDLRYLERCEARRRKPPLRHMGVDELYQGKRDKFLTVVCNLETAEPLWFGKERKQETLDDFFRSQLNRRQRKRIEAVCVDMW